MCGAKQETKQIKRRQEKTPLLPEFFLMVGIDIFLALSLLTGLLEQQFPKILPYAYQATGAFGVIEMIMARDFLIPLQASEETRFWYSVSLMSVAAANVVALNIYLAFVKHKRTMARVFSSTITIPVAVICLTFLTLYSSGGTTLELPQSLLLLIVAIVIGDTIATVFFLRFSGANRWRTHPATPGVEERQDPSRMQPFVPEDFTIPPQRRPRSDTDAEDDSQRPYSPHRFPYRRQSEEVNYSDEDQEA